MPTTKPKFLFLVLILALWPLISLWFILFNKTTEIIKENSLQKLETISTIQMQRLEEVFSFAIDSANLISSRTQMRILLNNLDQNNQNQSLEKIATILNDAISSTEYLNKISVFNTQNINIVTTRRKNSSESESFSINKDLIFNNKKIGYLEVDFNIQMILQKIQFNLDTYQHAQIFLFRKKRGAIIFLNKGSKRIRNIIKKTIDNDRQNFQLDDKEYYSFTKFSELANIGIAIIINEKKLLESVAKTKRTATSFLALIVVFVVLLSIFVARLGSNLILEQSTELKKMNKELKRSNNDLEQFAYIASHDLQEPIRMISQNTERLKKHLSDNSDQKIHKYINYIIQGSSRMSDLIDDLLKFSKVSSSKEGFEDVDLNEILEISLEDLSKKIDENNASIKNNKLPKVKGKKLQLIRLFQNLISNSIKYKQSSLDPIIEINYDSAKSTLSFKDNGIGFEQKDANRIFKLFQRLHNTNDYPGTGIGLAISRKIVELHGGEIHAKSKPGEGTTIDIKLSST